jgi:hypothetical protein
MCEKGLTSWVECLFTWGLNEELSLRLLSDDFLRLLDLRTCSLTNDSIKVFLASCLGKTWLLLILYSTDWDWLRSNLCVIHAVKESSWQNWVIKSCCRASRNTSISWCTRLNSDMAQCWSRSRILNLLCPSFVLFLNFLLSILQLVRLVGLLKLVLEIDL